MLEQELSDVYAQAVEEPSAAAEHDGHFLLCGGKSVHTPSKTSAAIPIDSPSVGCG